jgi:hypothetical protein
MAQQRPLAAGKNRGHPLSARPYPTPAGGICSSMQDTEPPGFNPSLDGPHAQTTGNQLATGHHSVLAQRKCGKLSFALGQRLALPLHPTCR